MPSSKIEPRSALEKKLMDKAFSGEWAEPHELSDLQDSSTQQRIDLTVDAALVRNLLLNLVDAPASSVKHRSILQNPHVRGVRLRRAVIKGEIDLSDCAGPEGAPLPPLLLENCIICGRDSVAHDIHDEKKVERREIRRAISARNARLSRLSLKGCRIDGRVDLTDAALGGDLEINGVAALNVPGTSCQIFAQRCTIAGSIVASNAHLNIPHDLLIDELDVPDFALNLGESKISGSIVLQPKFHANGGVNVSSAHVAGNIWAEAACIEAANGAAFRAELLQCDGVVALRSKERKEQDPEKQGLCELTGQLDFLGAKLGFLDLSGIRIRKKAHENCALILSFAHVRINLLLRGISFGYRDFYTWPINVQGMIVDGDLDLTGLELRPRSGDMPPEILASNLRVGGSLTLDNLDTSASINLESSHIGGELSIQWGKFTDLNAKNIEVGGSVSLRGGSFKPSQKSNALCFDGGHFHGEFLIKNFSFKSIFNKNIPRMSIEDACIDRDLCMEDIGARLVKPTEWAEHTPDKVLTAELSFYPGWRLFEALCPMNEENSKAIVAFLESENHGSPRLLSGKSDSIHAMNRDGRLKLDSYNVWDYVRFFCAYVWGGEGGEEGPFLITESEKALGHAKLSRNVDFSPPVVDGDELEGWTCKTYVRYAGNLFYVTLHVGSDGMVTMTDDEPLAEIRDLPPVAYVPPIRIVTSPRGPELTSDTAADTSVQQGRNKNSGEPISPFWLPLILDPISIRGDIPLDDVGAMLSQLGESEAEEAESSPEKFIAAQISLRGLKAAALRYEYDPIESIKLELEGLIYDRFHVEKETSTREAHSSAAHPEASDTHPPGWLQSLVCGLCRNVSVHDYSNGLRHHIKWLSRQYDGNDKTTVKLPDTPWMRLRNSSLCRRWFDQHKDHINDLREFYDRAGVPTVKKDYTPQPYEQLARALRNDGKFEEAKHITLMKLTLERRLKVVRGLTWGVYWIMEKCFDHGLFPCKSIVIFIGLWMIGWVGFFCANSQHHPVLMLHTPAVSTIALPGELKPDSPPEGGGPSVGMKEISKNNGIILERHCGDEVDTLWYALDVFVPLLDLKQEDKCSITTQKGIANWVWRALGTIYEILGAIVTPIMLLSVSGLLRRYVEE